MAAPRKYSDETRAHLLRLVTEDGLTIREACRQIRTRLEIQLPEKTAGEWVKQAQIEARPDLEGMELPELLDTSARGIFDLVNAEIHRMDRAKGGADPEALLTLARTLKELQPLTAQRPRGKAQDKPKGLLDSIATAPPRNHTPNATSSISAPVSARVEAA